MVSGLALALAFPPTNVASLAWIAPGLMLLAAIGTPPKRAFRLGYLAGLVHYLVSLHWLLFIPFPVGAVAGWLALSAYLALYPAIWVWWCWRVLPSPPTELTSLRFARRLGTDPMSGATNPDAPEGREAPSSAARRWPWLGRFEALPWAARTLWMLAAAAGWVALEIGVGRFLTGFPWNFLGVSQCRVLPLVQIASVTGVYGVSFLVAWTSVALLCAGLKLLHRLVTPSTLTRMARLPFPPSPNALRLAMFTDLALPLLAILAVGFWGARRLTRPQA